MSVTAHIEPEKTTCSQGCSSGADRCFFGSPGFCCRESRVGSAAGRWSRLRLLPMGYGNSRPGKLLRQEKLESTLGRQTCETASLTPSCSGNSLSPIHVCDEVRWIDLRKPGDGHRQRSIMSGRLDNHRRVVATGPAHLRKAATRSAIR